MANLPAAQNMTEAALELHLYDAHGAMGVENQREFHNDDHAVEGQTFIQPHEHGEA